MSRLSTHRDFMHLLTVGQINEFMTNGEFDGKAYDEGYPERVRQTIY